jgi:flagellar FliJ protein
MSSELKSSIERLARVVDVRRTYTTVAEAAYRDAESQVARLLQADEELERQIQVVRAEIAQSSNLAIGDIQVQEKFIEALGIKRKKIQQTLEKAKANLEEKRLAWIEARRDERAIEKVRERRLQEWEREQELAKQQLMDDLFIGRLVRSRLAQ